ncbi:MAG: thiamine pyrophosphate-binding protein, partial [Lachnospiraceae bacterium]|nr:thiamine pyrophosphate-binding protein [Lachnospiraceae bacterium]
MRLVDYIANYIVDNGITDGFSVVGGGAVHLNDAFGHKDGLNMLYNHHEQASSMAAESYARLHSKPALVCVTTGPGGINALNGVACAYLDSLPMLVISGQVRYDTTEVYEKEITGASLRSEGDQEYHIVESVKAMTKYAVMIKDKDTIRYHLERALYLATTGRKGPTWIDIPVDIQNSDIDPTTQKSYFDSDEYNDDKKYICDVVSDDDIKYVLSEVKKAKRPVLYAGYGIRLAGAYDSFKKMIEKLDIPVVTYWNAIDLIETDHRLYCGRGGNMGDRPGNFAVQNSDLLIIIGSRVSIRQTGYLYSEWAKKAKVIMIDIDKEEMKKHTLHIDKKINADAKVFIDKMNDALDKDKRNVSDDQWIKKCHEWKEKYKVVTDKNYIKQTCVTIVSV